MAETIPGGVYADAPGADTYHDANGKPVTKESVAEHLKLVEERTKQAEALEAEAVRRQAAQLAGLRQLMTPQAVAPPRPTAPERDVDAEQLAYRVAETVQRKQRS